ncbi:MAG: BON domain-containing protein [Candidatus Acidiferrales bacterium]
MGNRLVLAVAVLSIFFAIGCAKKADDAAIITNIQSRMFSDPQLKGSELKVTSTGGEVTLSGTVPGDAARLDAYKLALQTAGVTKVTDQMSVGLGQSPSAADASAPAAQPAAQTMPPDAVPVRRPKAASSSRKNPSAPADAMPQEPPQTAEAVAPPPPTAIEANAAQPSAPSSVVPVAPPAPAPAPQPKNVVIPASSTVSIRMIDGIDSSVNRSGEIFHASLDAPLVVGDSVVVPRGADVYVRLTSASSAGHLKGKSELHLELLKMDFQGRSYDLASDTYTEVGSSRGANTAKKVGGGAIAGALLGGLLGGGRGAAIGAGVGAGGGAVYQGATKGKQVKIPAETKLDFQLAQPVTVTVMPRPDAPTE